MRFRLASLLEALRQNTEGSLIDRVGIAPPPMMHSGIIQAREFDDPPGLHEKTEYLLREWVNLYHSPAAGLDSTKAFSSFVAQVFIACDALLCCVLICGHGSVLSVQREKCLMCHRCPLSPDISIFMSHYTCP